jgi:hypothetical protein
LSISDAAKMFGEAGVRHPYFRHKVLLFPGYLDWWKLFTVQQDIDEVRRSYAETEAPVKADADPACTVCGGKAWHRGWDAITREPVMLRCPRVDRWRAS